MKKKIGLVIAHHNTNYGALLQGFATQQVVDSLGFETEIVDYKAIRFRRGLKFYWGLIPYFWHLLNNSRRKRKQIVLEKIHEDNRIERRKRWHEFEKEYLHDIKLYHGLNSLKEAVRSCKGVLIGSDQMWLPGVSFGTYLSLRFVPKNIRTISYATSLGVSEYPKYCYSSAKDMFENIDFLSVREEQGKKIIHTVSPGLPVKVVCDPTYLLSKDEWEKRIPFRKMSDEPYILCYFLGSSAAQKNLALKFARSKGLKCYSILSDESVDEIDTTFADKTITGASVEDFINLIRCAEYVITDSFHGLAFSVINEKQFFVFYRKRIDSKANRNSRIDNILKMWKIQNRLIVSPEEKMEDIPEIDYNVVTSLVATRREDSMEFLKKALTF